MKWLVFLVALTASPGLSAQDAPKKKKPAVKKQMAHKKPTSEQIRKFNELERKKR